MTKNKLVAKAGLQTVALERFIAENLNREIVGITRLGAIRKACDELLQCVLLIQDDEMKKP